MEQYIKFIENSYDRNRIINAINTEIQSGSRIKTIIPELIAADTKGYYVLFERPDKERKKEPQLVRYVNDGVFEDDDDAYCPNCDKLLNDYWGCGYCLCCGQALEW